MCLFPRPAPIGHKIDSFKCGTCPECLSDKSKLWALRCSFEAEKSPAMMLTLTYDNYIRDGRGNIVGEQLDTRPVSKRDCQLFIKRLRKYVDKVSPGTRCKYLLCAEYGKRTHRSHYHCIIFGYQFTDCVFYKRSKRGNIIYRSNTLEKIWHNGICTVDSLIVGPQVARYCTKYCAKDTRCDDTFMLFSRGIGDDGLHEKFNGKSYIIQGREYPIPRLVWQWYITKKYSQFKDRFTTKYLSYRTIRDKIDKQVGSLGYIDIPIKRLYDGTPITVNSRYRSGIVDCERNIYVLIPRYYPDDCIKIAVDLERSRSEYLKSLLNKTDFFDIVHNKKVYNISRPFKTDYYYSARRYDIQYNRYLQKKCFYRYLRDNDVIYKNYLKYWHNKIEQLKLTKASEFDRIRALPDNKYFMYKQKALENYNPNYSACCPRSGKTFYKWTFDWKSFGALAPCHNAPNDTKKKKLRGIERLVYSKRLDKLIFLLNLQEDTKIFC